jgi:hypothetical protein
VSLSPCRIIKHLKDKEYLIELNDEYFSEKDNVYIGIDIDIRDRNVFYLKNLVKKRNNRTYKAILITNHTDVLLNTKLEATYYSSYFDGF